MKSKYKCKHLRLAERTKGRWFGFGFLKRKENPRQFSRIEKTHTRPCWIPSRWASSRAAASLSMLDSRYRNGRPCWRAHRFSMALQTFGVLQQEWFDVAEINLQTV